MQGKVRILQWALSNHHLMGSFEYTNEPSHPIDSTKLVREILLAFMKGKGRKLPATYRLQHTTQPVNKRFSEFCDVLREYIHMLTGSAPSIEEIKGGQTAIFYESNE
ncbi:hypothetical protein SARC_06985 [Sphaeroforma arctica JP610]|uniref:Uncharacterized protein n=1 Tax=Sphaeroforma arctica JP610 TaxID=667725 RepID=A0A0L0FVU5_9EUKA|nr:hypothetical protein SARC_06985 [Sphaeroforma arctica JP610]KNC80671.1 hypothetical protein SARC_06985 [Sphaeroforma arctica JP610]|eukprot:XP_014154573.1 hypothetical protein SARC_06985 [Sphaeroforma arctica JP610]